MNPHVLRCAFAFVLGALVLAPPAHAQCTQARTIDAYFVETSAGPYDPGDTYEATLYLASTAGEDLGVSTMVLDFNDAALSYPEVPVKGVDYAWLNYDGAQTSQGGGTAFYNSEVRFTAADRLTVFVNFGFSTDGTAQPLPAEPTPAVAIRWTVVDPTEGMALSPRSQQFYNSFSGTQAPLGCYATGDFGGLEAGQQAVAGDAGWRMLGPPAGGLTVDDLAALNLVQGVPGHFPTAAANLHAGYDGSAFTLPPSAPAELTPGTGLLWYLYEPDDFAGEPPAEFSPLPLALRHAGRTVAAVTPGGAIGPDAYTAPLHAAAQGWNLLANPFSTPFDVAQLAPVGGAFVSAVGQVWDDTAGDEGQGTYVLTSDAALDDRVAGWQGFFLQNATATGATFPSAGRATGGAFVDRGAAPPSALAFTLTGVTDAGAAVADRAARLVLDPAAAEGWDLQDAGKLTPLGTTWAAVAFAGERDGAPVLKAQEARPLPDGGFQVPMVFEAAGADGDYELAWTLEGLPDDVALLLLDTETGMTVDLRATDRYAFRGHATRSALAGLALPGASLDAEGEAFTAPRFVLAVGQGVATPTDPSAHAPEALALDSPAPNPVVGSARLRYALPEAVHVRLTVVDMLGREVAVLADAERPAGHHTATLEARALAAGLYVVRLETPSASLTRRLTVVR